MIIMEFLALLFCGIFFGAAVYISIAQHPAAMYAGTPVASTFFPPMYARAAPMQITSAVGGTLAGLVQWYLTGNMLWMIGAVLLVSVIPFTLIVMKPINDQLLNPALNLSEAESESLLVAWAKRHWVRSIASGAGFMVYLWVSIAA